MDYKVEALMPRVYIGGPMRGIPEFNFPAFDEARDRGKELGWEVTSPADMDRDVSGDKALISELPNWDGSKDTRPYVERDIDVLLSFTPHLDAIALLPGWENSTGARAEAAVAQWIGLRVLDARTFEPFLPAAPTQRAGDPRFHRMLKLIGDLHDKKQADYGSKSDPFANVRASEEFGVAPWVGALVRLNDKVTRLKQFSRRGTLANESAKDSMLDISVYALIAHILYEEVESALPNPNIEGA